MAGSGTLNQQYGGSFLNNTAMVAAFLEAISRQERLAPSLLITPLSYAYILGGIITLEQPSGELV